LQCRYDQLVAKNSATISQLQAEVQALQQQVRQQSEQLAWIRSSGNAVAGTSTVSELLNQLRTEHEALLQRQLDDIRNECLRICSSHAMQCTVNRADTVDSSQSQLVDDDDELTGSCVAVVNDNQTAVSCANYESVTAADVSCTTDVQSDSLHVHDITIKRRLSPSFDLDCTTVDGLLAKSTKLF